MIQIRRGALVGALVLGTAVAAHAETVKGVLSAAAEVPPNSSKATGTFTGNFDPSTRKLTYTVTYADLTGPAMAAHFHAPAPAGKNAGVEVPVKGSLASPIKGELTLTDAQAKNLTDGMTYFNIHTAKNKAGEIRGQLALDK